MSNATKGGTIEDETATAEETKKDNNLSRDDSITMADESLIPLSQDRLNETNEASNAKVIIIPPMPPLRGQFCPSTEDEIIEVERVEEDETLMLTDAETEDNEKHQR